MGVGPFGKMKIRFRSRLQATSRCWPSLEGGYLAPMGMGEAWGNP